MKDRRQQARLALLRALGAGRTLWMPGYPHGLRKAPRILVVRPDHLGDLLFATPALRMLRAAFPDAHLAAMVGPWGRPVLEHNPHLDEVIVCEFPGFARKPKASWDAPYRALRQWAAQIHKQRFDMAIILRFDHWWGALLAYLARIPLRLGYDIPECAPFLTDAVPYVEGCHEVLQNLTLAQHAVQTGGRHATEDGLTLEFHPSAQDHAFIASYLQGRGVAQNEPLVGIHPGAGAAVKRWLPEKFAAVLDALQSRWNGRTVITGGPDEIDLGWSVYAHSAGEPIVAAGQTSLGQLAALFQHCALVIGPDCGPLHLAVAMGTPTVHLYGPVDPRKFGPWGDPTRHRVVTSLRPCQPCNRLDYAWQEVAEHPCVREISVEAVVEAAFQARDKTEIILPSTGPG